MGTQLGLFSDWPSCHLTAAASLPRSRPSETLPFLGPRVVAWAGVPSLGLVPAPPTHRGKAKGRLPAMKLSLQCQDASRLHSLCHLSWGKGNRLPAPHHVTSHLGRGGFQL